MTEQPMGTAPTDGTRVLIKAVVYGFLPDRQGFRSHRAIGSRWVECRYLAGCWQEWDGRMDRQTSATITPLAWAPLPGVQTNAQ
jgi:hypothetical protein